MDDNYDDDHDGHVSGIFDARVELTAVKEKLALAESLLKEAKTALMAGAWAARMQFASKTPEAVNWRRLERETDATCSAITVYLSQRDS